MCGWGLWTPAMSKLPCKGENLSRYVESQGNAIPMVSSYSIVAWLKPNNSGITFSGLKYRYIVSKRARNCWYRWLHFLGHCDATLICSCVAELLLILADIFSFITKTQHTLIMFVQLVQSYQDHRNWSGQSGNGLASFISSILKSSYNKLKSAVYTFVSFFILETAFLYSYFIIWALLRTD